VTSYGKVIELLSNFFIANSFKSKLKIILLEFGHTHGIVGKPSMNKRFSEGDLEIF